MKKIISTIILLCITAIGFAQTFTDNGFNFNVLSTNPNEVEVTGGSDGSAPLTIPSTATDGNGIVYTVTTIGNSAYRNGANNGVILPNTITTIGGRAFRDNSGMTTLTLPASVTSIGGEAFFRTGLNEIIVLGTVPASINSNSFGTRSVIDLTLPNGLEETYRQAGWTGFNTVNGEIPVGATFEIGDLRYRVTSKSPREVEVAARLNGIVDIVMPTAVTEPQFNDSYAVTGVGFRAFRNASINSVTFSNTIQTIKTEAFELNNLTTVTLPASLTTIDTEAFRDNPLTEIISQAVAAPTLGTNSIRNRSEINLTIPNGSETAYLNGGWTGFFTINGTPAIGSDFSVDGFVYRINGNNPNTVEIRSGGSGITDLVLPSSVTKNTIFFTVTAIGQRAFRSKNLNSVVLPPNLEFIRNEAFELNNLTTITLPSSVTAINFEAFRDNPLTEIISQAVAAPTLGTNSIRNRGNISLTIPSGSEAAYVSGGWTGFFAINGTPFIGTSFSVDGFNYRTNGVNPNTVEITGGGSGIDDLVLPSSVTQNSISFTVTAIGSRGFRNRGLNSLVLPSNVEVIGSEAFEINNLTTITFPASVTTIEDQAFSENSLIEVLSQAVAAPTIEALSIRDRGNISLTVPNGSEAAYVNGGWTGFFVINGTPVVGASFSVDGFNYQINGVNPNTLAITGGGTGIVDLVIPNTVARSSISFTVTAVGDQAFRNRGINSILLPANIETIGFEAFELNNLTTITLPASVTMIDREAFINNSLTQITFNSGPETIGNAAFRNNQLTNVTIPNGTITIGSSAFMNNAITSATLPTSVDIIDNEAFRDNQLASIIVPTGVLTIGRSAFLNNVLTNVTITNTVQTIETDAFRNNQLTSINLPSSLTTLGAGAFRNNQLTSIVIPDGVTVINSVTFRDNNLTSVTLPANLQTIRNDAFRNNELTSINFPASLTELQGFAFRNNQLTSVTIPPNITSIQVNTFSGNQLTDITIPANITSIENSAFANNPLNTITADSATPATITSSSFGTRSTVNLFIIPDQQSVIDDYTAVGWTGFGSINGEFQIGARFTEGDLQYEVTSVNPNIVKVLNRVTSAQTITIPATIVESFSNISFNVTTIEDAAFQNTDITTVTIGTNIETIGNNAFQGASLTAVNAQGTTPATITASSFGDRSTIALTLPNGTETAYEAAGWTGFLSVNGQLSNGALGSNFTDNDITYEITSINPNEVAVAGGAVTSAITIPTQVTFETETFAVTTVGANAFQNADITSVTLPASITAIGSNAFNTISLTEVIALGTTPATIETNSFGENENISLTIPNGTETTYEAAGWTGFFSVNGSGPSVGSRFTVNGIQYEILTLSPNTLSAVARNGNVPNGDFIFPELISKDGIDFIITEIGSSAFRNRGVRTISFPSTITTIRFRAFRDNNSLTSVTIPARVTNISIEAFSGGGLREVISEGNIPASINTNGSFGTKTNVDIFIPAGTTQTYLDAGWVGFKSLIEAGTVIVEPKVFLQGASINPNVEEEELMRDDLRVAGIIPTTSPYADALTCNASVFNITGNNAIVDWVFVELRDAVDNSIVIEGRSALLQRDGDVVDVNGIGILKFASLLDNYFVAIRHRNHLGIMSNTALQLDGSRVNLDFTDATSPIAFGTNAQTDSSMPANTLGMWTGNVNGDSIVQYSGTDPDAPAILSLVLNDAGNFLNFSTFVVNGYNANDLDMDGRVQYEGVAPDAPFILQNVLAHPGNFLNFSTFQIQEQLPEN
ncbi:MAG: leucine-rich repeat protein [Bacteroidota bacterium]